MGKSKLDYNIFDCYSHEVDDIVNKLNQLERGRIYELSNAQMDGYLATNVAQLRKMIAELLSKIQNGEDGTAEKLAEVMNRMKF